MSNHHTKPVKSPIQNWHIAHTGGKSHMAKTNIHGAGKYTCPFLGGVTPDYFGQACGSVSYNMEKLKNWEQ